MNNIFKRLVSLLLVFISCFLLFPTDSRAAATVIIRAPFTATVIVNGKTLTDKDMSDYGYMDGRIQRIACEQYAVVCKYKDYTVTVGNLNEIAVYDSSNQALKYTIRNNNVLDYTSSSNEAFMTAYVERIKGAATAYHNRVGGYGSTSFGSYFLNGSDAYIKGNNSDAGRKWGQYVKAPTIKSLVVSEVFLYSPEVFSAKVDVQASGSYYEVYSIYFLFKKVNGQYYVTNFTYQD